MLVSSGDYFTVAVTSTLCTGRRRKTSHMVSTEDPQFPVLTPPLLCRFIMAGTIQPIAALTSEDFGPINTVVSIVLSVTSILIAIVRMAMRRQKFYQFEPDDIVFCAALVYFTLRISISISLTRCSALVS